MNIYKFRHQNGTARIRARNAMEAQIKFKKKYQVQFIKYKQVK